MDKEKLLKDLLKSLLENRITKLEKKNTEESKDLKIIKTFFKKQEELIKTFKIIKKNEPSQKKLLKQKTSTLKLYTSRRLSTRLHTPVAKKKCPKKQR